MRGVHMKRKSFFFLILSATLLFTVTRTSFAQVNSNRAPSPQSGRVTSAFLKADDGSLSGPCPIALTFNGYITTDGPATVQYTFTRSDGATGPVHVLEFQAAGTQPVSTSWTLGDAKALPTYKGWQAIRVFSP